MNASTLTAGELILGTYEILRPLGAGGMGRVFMGRHRLSGRPVVVKSVHEHLADDPKVRLAFTREVEMMRRFRHPNAVALLDADLTDAQCPCLVLEYVPGISLDALLESRGRLTPDHVGRLLGQLGPVLQAAHDGGLLHRDLTPANLMVIDPGSPNETLKVLDFGLARGSGFYLSVEQLQGAGSEGCGTPDYVSPEQIQGNEVDHRTDLYSVGGVLYKLLTGHVPFEAVKDIDAILLAHLREAPPPFAAWGVSDLPPAIEAVVLRCLNKYPAERFGSARELTEAYQHALGEPILPAGAFDPPAGAPPVAEARPLYDPCGVIDHLEAWMPEQVAAMKLRGFIEEVGGQVAESEPGLIKVRVADPAGRTAPVAPPPGFWWWLKAGPPAPPPAAPLILELHVAKKQAGTRSLVDITVVREVRRPEPPADAEVRKDYCQQICRELRAYLMIGR